MTYFEAIEAHLAKFINSNECIVLHEKHSPDFHLDIYMIKPNEYRPYYLLLTNGISSNPVSTPNNKKNTYIELTILLPTTWKFDSENLKKEHYYWPIKELKSIGRYIHNNKTWLCEGHIIEKENANTIDQTYFKGHIVIKSITLPDDFCQIPWDDKIIQVFTLMPLYLEEISYINSNGLKELYRKFRESEISDIVDIKRINICEK